ncbi:MAG: CoA pyrophosphatase [Acidimicrobiaceae bacterium]|nr:CoA pyrophosphatase [Acidimicrobiaceae bacterium]MYA74352.1 CoA pyrophosphatase [Acidimicrobiaceae bacterium]MYC41166.1 CoA pyrophosphatase [Acidimicrobiaceae bacterium]MYG55008.1 CoA pyrophosphatase [Acidimicrobiaceae bacterium]MYH88041.1 CoA pyrophosphatase [Acidimicrobiaceae bacterium]
MTTDRAGVFSLENEENQPMASIPAGRGGPQEIPRPDGAKMGGPAPWAHIPIQDRQVTLADITTAFSRHRSPQLVGTVSEGIGHSAVLCLLYERSDDVYMVLTRRSPRLRHHAHEVAFPGGRRETSDVDLWTTAVREAQEEVGIDPAAIRRIGELDSFVTVGSRTMVTPFVAVTDEQPKLERDPIEVELIRHVSFSELLLDEVWREEFWPLPHYKEPRAITFFELVGDTVWGATGAILRQLLTIATGVEDAADTAGTVNAGVVVG